MERVESHACFGGTQTVWSHDSKALDCAMRFGVYLPPQAGIQPCPVLYWLSGLTCTEQNFISKAGAQRFAAEHGLIIVAPDTSPRGGAVPDDETYDLGQGAGFHLNATEPPWSAHYHMYDYVVEQLPRLIEKAFPARDVRGILRRSREQVTRAAGLEVWPALAARPRTGPTAPAPGSAPAAAGVGG